MGSVLLLKWKINEWNKAPEVQGSDLVHKAPPPTAPWNIPEGMCFTTNPAQGSRVNVTGSLEVNHSHVSSVAET